jgi:hypothetical protein
MTEPYCLRLVATKVKGVHWFSSLKSENGFVRARDRFVASDPMKQLHAIVTGSPACGLFGLSRVPEFDADREAAVSGLLGGRSSGRGEGR